MAGGVKGERGKGKGERCGRWAVCGAAQARCAPGLHGRGKKAGARARLVKRQGLPAYAAGKHRPQQRARCPAGSVVQGGQVHQLPCPPCWRCQRPLVGARQGGAAAAAAVLLLLLLLLQPLHAAGHSGMGDP